jgi:hypothetical protein
MSSRAIANRLTQQQLEKRQTTQNAKQKKFHDAKQEAALCQEDIISSQRVAKDIMVERDQSRLVCFTILQCIHKELFKCLRPKNIKLVMEKVLANPTFQSCLPDSFIPKKLAIATKELVVGMCVSLQETKSSKSNVKLVTKHTILTTTNNLSLSNIHALKNEM